MDALIPKIQVLIGADYCPALIADLDAAKRSVKVLMFDWRWYTFEPGAAVQQINMALARAASRGLYVQCITNFEAIVAKLKEAKLDARRFGLRELLHSKVVMIDDEITYIGSHNFTTNAFNFNYETSVRLQDEATAKNFSAYFDRLWQL